MTETIGFPVQLEMKEGGRDRGQQCTPGVSAVAGNPSTLAVVTMEERRLLRFRLYPVWDACADRELAIGLHAHHKCFLLQLGVPLIEENTPRYSTP